MKKFALVLCFAFAASILAAGVALAADPHAPVFEEFKPFVPGDLAPEGGSVLSGDVTPFTQDEMKKKMEKAPEGAVEGKIYSVITAFGISGTPGSGDAYFRFRLAGDYKGVPYGLKKNGRFAPLTLSGDFYIAAETRKIAVKKGGDFDLGKDLVQAEVALIDVKDTPAVDDGGSGGCALGFAPAGFLLLAPLFFFLKR